MGNKAATFSFLDNVFRRAHSPPRRGGEYHAFKVRPNGNIIAIGCGVAALCLLCIVPELLCKAEVRCRGRYLFVALTLPVSTKSFNLCNCSSSTDPTAGSMDWNPPSI